MKNLSIGVVLVTFNRLEELKKAIPCYEQQTLPPKYIIVVNNCSTDGTEEYLRGWIGDARPYMICDESKETDTQSHPEYTAVCRAAGDGASGMRSAGNGAALGMGIPGNGAASGNSGITKIVINIPENRGGSGGFYAGLKCARARSDAGWIWVADDDAFPEPDAFEKADRFAKEHREMMRKCAAFCGMCVDDNSRAATLHQARIRKTLFGRQELPVSAKEFEQEYFRMDLYTFAGTFLRREALLKAGLPIEDFFIYQDDYEHACRMRKLGYIFCVPGVVIHHNDNYMVADQVSWRDYYASRNIVMMYKWHFDRYSMWMRTGRRFLMVCTSRNPKKIGVTLTAIRDGLREKRGLHPIYRPGWKG